MPDTLSERIARDPHYREMVATRQKLAIALSVVVLVVYFGFILVIGFAPGILAQPLGEGMVTTVGIPVGIGVILMAFVVTGIYVRIANKRFDDQNNEILRRFKS